MATVKKAQKGKSVSAKYAPMKKGSFADVMGKTLDETDVFSKNYKKLTPAEEAKAAKQAAEIQKKSKAGKAFKKGGVVKKAKSGGSFPDLNKDGKVTRADILKGRGVIAKSGTKMKKK